MTKISGEGDNDYPPIVAGGRLQNSQRAILAAVVDEDHFMRAARQRVENGRQPLKQLGKHLFFVVDRNGDRNAHGRILEWSGPACFSSMGRPDTVLAAGVPGNRPYSTV